MHHHPGGHDAESLTTPSAMWKTASSFSDHDVKPHTIGRMMTQNSTPSA
jgi:hypothetical protein